MFSRRRFNLVYHILLYNLLPSPSLRPVPGAFAFQVQCPTSVQTGQAVQCTWIRTSGDGSSFGLLLRETTQDHGGTLVTTVENTSQDQGSFQVTFPDATQYLLEVVKNLEPVPSDQVPQILASSSTITAKSNTQQQPSPADPTSDSGGNSSNSNGQSQQTSTSSSVRTPGNLFPSPSPSSGDVGSSSTGDNSEGSGTSPAPSSPLSTQSSSSPGSPLQPTSSITPGGSSSSSSNKLALIIGLTLGLLTFVLLLLALLIFLLRRRRRYATTVFYREKMGGRRLVFSSGSPEGGYGGAFASGVGAGVGGAGAMVVEKLPSSDAYNSNRKDVLSVPAGRGARSNNNNDNDPPPGSNRHSAAANRPTSQDVIDLTAAGVISGYAYSISEYSDRTSRTGSLDSKIAELWRNARVAINGLTRARSRRSTSRRTIQSGYSGYYGDGNIRVDGSDGTSISRSGSGSGSDDNDDDINKSGTSGTNFSFHVTQPSPTNGFSSSLSSSEPSVFYTAVPKPQQPQPQSSQPVRDTVLDTNTGTGTDTGELVGGNMGSGIGFVKADSSKTGVVTTLMDRLTPWFHFPTFSRPPPQAGIPTSTVPSWHSNSSNVNPVGEGSTADTTRVSYNANVVPFPSSNAQSQSRSSNPQGGGTLTVPTQAHRSAQSHSTEATNTEEGFGSYASYVSLLGLPHGTATSPGQNHESPLGPRQSNGSSFTWASVKSGTSSTVSYPPVSHGIMTTVSESHLSHGRSDEY
ncbi:hypothetical protein K435DRAFT_62137 [Dendrothele bispora CBS 962.96]|uniref:Uncharacterized protein n=1 Tax=Dendrothele bispora (strain CBS 962.96) TaxID=1314807 RepID=A0A4S8MRY5_DENBC|nr:hypothetical protein K435DRAFT_62137 [Dendrothele bispora CBS 962.96]